jgi:hypothetical protein
MNCLPPAAAGAGSDASDNEVAAPTAADVALDDALRGYDGVCLDVPLLQVGARGGAAD